MYRYCSPVWAVMSLVCAAMFGGADSVRADLIGIDPGPTLVAAGAHTQCSCSCCSGACGHDHGAAASNAFTFGGGEEPANFIAAGSKWPITDVMINPIVFLYDVKYSYGNLLNGQLKGGLTPNQIRGAVEEALGLWASYAPLRFHEVEDTGPAVISDLTYPPAGVAQIRFGHHSIDGATGQNVIAHAFYPGSGNGRDGDVHLDSDNTFRLVRGNAGFDILETLLHEIGHALGLAHETLPTSGGQEAIMNARYVSRFNGLGTAYLLQDDINGIRSLYGTGVGSVTPLVPLHPASLSGAALLLFAAIRRMRRAA